MIDTLPMDGGAVVALRVRGKLTHDDYRDVIIPRLQRALADNDLLRCLCILGVDYEGITAGALWEEVKFDIKHRKDFERIAVVTDDAVVRAGVRLTKALFSGEVRLYGNDQADAAADWVQDGRAR